MVNAKNTPKVTLKSSTVVSPWGWTWDFEWECTKAGCTSCGGFVNGTAEEATKQAESDANDNHWADR